MKLPYPDNKFQQVTEIYYYFLLSSPTSRQIWLIPLVDDRPCDYITQLKALVKRLLLMIQIPPLSKGGWGCLLFSVNYNLQNV
jgi:hypothetical protein